MKRTDDDQERGIGCPCCGQMSLALIGSLTVLGVLGGRLACRRLRGKERKQWRKMLRV